MHFFLLIECFFWTLLLTVLKNKQLKNKKNVRKITFKVSRFLWMFPSPFVKTDSFPYQDWTAIKVATGWYSFIISKICWLLMSVHWLVGSASSPTTPPSTWVGVKRCAARIVEFITYFNYAHILDEGSDGSLSYSHRKRPVINHNEDLIKIPLLLPPVWLVIKEKIWLKGFINIL